MESCAYNGLVADLVQHATAEMQRLSNTEMVKEPPMTDAAWQEWHETRQLQKDRIALDDEQAREEWLKFQGMIASGYDRNLLAANTSCILVSH